MNKAKQDIHKLQKREKELQTLLKESEKLKREMQSVLDKEKHQQQIEMLKQQNRITEERIAYLKDMERKLKQILIEWRKEEDKSKVIKQMQALLFRKAVSY